MSGAKTNKGVILELQEQTKVDHLSVMILERRLASQVLKQYQRGSCHAYFHEIPEKMRWINSTSSAIRLRMFEAKDVRLTPRPCKKCALKAQLGIF